MADDERAIRALVASWMSASKAGDIATVLGLMSDDVVFMVPGQEPFGKEAFAAGSKAMTGAKIEGTSDISPDGRRFIARRSSNVAVPELSPRVIAGWM